MKKSMGMVFVAVIFILLPYAHAGFFDFFKRITGYPISEATNVSVSVGNTPPIVTSVQSVSSVNLLAGTTTDVIFNFTATDNNGVGDLNDASASARFNFSTEERSGNCVLVLTVGLEKTYQCTVTMEYFDAPADWTINVSVGDSAGNFGENLSTLVTVTLLLDISINPSNIGFPTVATGQIDVLASQNTSVTNNGNYEGTLDLLSFNLTGETINTEYIPAENFNVSGLSGVDTVCDTGTELDDEVGVTISGSNLPRGAVINSENLTYCLAFVPIGLSSQTYSTRGVGSQAWVISTT